MKIKIRFFLATTILSVSFSALLGCGGTKGDGDFVDAPSLDFECAFIDAAGCDSSNSGATTYIALSEDTETDCATQLTGVSGASLHTEFAYSSEVVAASPTTGILSGVTAQWVNSFEMPVVLLPKDTFKVCAFIDLNNNEQIDSLEPIQDSLLTMGADFLPLSNWSNY